MFVTFLFVDYYIMNGFEELKIKIRYVKLPSSHSLNSLESFKFKHYFDMCIIRISHRVFYYIIRALIRRTWF